MGDYNESNVAPAYPSLTPRDRMVMPKPRLKWDDEIPLRVEEEEVPEKSKWRNALDTVKRKFERDKSKTMELPAFNPELESTQAGALAQLIAEKADISALKRVNFTIDKLQTEGCSIEDFHTAGYNLHELHQLIPTWKDLLASGFNKNHLGEHWQINQIVTLYGTQELQKAELCADLNFNMEDFMLARTTPDEYRQLGIQGDTLVQMGIDFEHLFALHMPLEEFVKEFNITKETVFAFNLTQHQARALSATRGWNLVALGEVLHMSDSEIQAFGVALEPL